MVTPLEQRIDEFNQLLEDMRAETQRGHQVLRDIRNEKREIDRLLKAPEIRKRVDDRVDEVVKSELALIMPTMKTHTDKIYAQVQKQVDILIDLCLGKEHSTKEGREDLRPELAAKLRVWIFEMIQCDQENCPLEREESNVEAPPT